MRILVIGAAIPFRRHGEEGVIAANIVLSQLLAYFQSQGHSIVLQPLFHPSRKSSELTAAEKHELDLRTAEGMEVLPPIHPSEHVPQESPRRMRVLRMALSEKERMTHFSPSVALVPMLRERAEKAKADVILTFWSPEAVAATNGLRIPRVALQGDIDPLVPTARVGDRWLFDPSFRSRPMLQRTFQALDQRLRNALHMRQHRTLMLGLDRIANITDCNTKWYASQGHPHSRYVGNMWIDDGHAPALEVPPPLSTSPLRIIGHAGYVNRTGGTYALRFLLQDVVPELEKLLNDRPFEVHVMGGGAITPTLQPYLSHPRLRVQGFVPDLDAELLKSHVFCVLNNAAPYQAAYTRHLVAWSMGLCLVAHEKSKLAIPEIEHGVNAMLGSTGREVAQAIVRACTDETLNHTLRKNGRETFVRRFTPPIVGKMIEEELIGAASRTC